MARWDEVFKNNNGDEQGARDQEKDAMAEGLRVFSLYRFGQSGEVFQEAIRSSCHRCGFVPSHARWEEGCERGCGYTVVYGHLSAGTVQFLVPYTRKWV